MKMELRIRGSHGCTWLVSEFYENELSSLRPTGTGGQQVKGGRASDVGWT